jgi:hypothetical protein
MATLVMFARLNACFNWINDDGSFTPFVLSDVSRYAGMICGKDPRGCMCSRPLVDFEALSMDGEAWLPAYELRLLIPWESHGV